MIDEREPFEEAFEMFDRPEPAWERLVGRRDRKRRNQRIAAGVVGMAVFVAVIWIVTSVGPLGREPSVVPGGTSLGPAVTGPVEATGPIPETDYMLDLNSGEMTPLPESIVGTEAGSYADTGDYAVSPDGSKLAFVRPGDDGKNQIFVANIDGTGVEQVTDAGSATTAPTWSPDGSRIAYLSVAEGDDLHNVFVLDLTTDSSKQLTFHTWPTGVASDPVFARDGSSIVYDVYNEHVPPADEIRGALVDEIRMVPSLGGESVPLVPRANLLQVSPDGSLMYFNLQDGREIYVANADGTGARVVNFPGWLEPSWSPDGTRIAYWAFYTFKVFVQDVASGEGAKVARGRGAVWLDDHTLIVERTGCPGTHERYEKCFG
jgi:Tol biopolymer transport system component